MTLIAQSFFLVLTANIKIFHTIQKFVKNAQRGSERRIKELFEQTVIDDISKDNNYLNNESDRRGIRRDVTMLLTCTTNRALDKLIHSAVRLICSPCVLICRSEPSQKLSAGT